MLDDDFDDVSTSLIDTFGELVNVLIVIVIG